MESTTMHVVARAGRTYEIPVPASVIADGAIAVQEFIDLAIATAPPPAPELEPPPPPAGGPPRYLSKE